MSEISAPYIRKTPTTFEKYGLTLPITTDHIALEMHMIRKGGQWKGSKGQSIGRGLFYHFIQLESLLWPHKVWHKWSELTLDCYLKYRGIGCIGPASCVAGNTRIDNPITGERTTIKELCDSGTAPTVMTLHGPTLASVPFVKGFADLFEVTMEDGSMFTATGEHLVLTGSGFQRVSSCGAGTLLCGYAPSRIHSSSDTGRTARVSNAERWKKIIQDSEFDCRPCFYSYDEQLPVGEEIFSGDSPSRCGAQAYMEYASVCGDDLEHTLEHNHLCQQFGPLSTSSTSLPLGRMGISFSPRAYEETQQPGAGLSLSPAQFQISGHHENSSSKLAPNWPCKPQSLASAPRHFGLGMPSQNSQSFQFVGKSHSALVLENTSVEPNFDSCRKRRSLFSSLDYKVHPVAVASIRWVGRDFFYDLQVPNHHHYFAEGAVHHNSGKSFNFATDALCDYYCFSDCTTVLCCSTTREMLEQRIWGEIKRHHLLATRLRSWIPGHMIDSRQRIVTDDKSMTAEGRDFRNGILGVCAKKGGDMVGLGDFAGVKNRRVRLIADELSLLPRVFVDAISNLDKNPDFKAVGLGNPKDVTDALGVFCEPSAILGGWDGGIDQTPGTKTWETRRPQSICIQLPGSDSPNLDGKMDIPLIKQEDMDRDIAFYGKDSLWFTMMNEGKMPRGQGSRRVLTRNMCIKHRAMEEPVWKNPKRTKVAFLDAAYKGVGGDRCVYGELEFGEESEPLQDLGTVVVENLTNQKLSSSPSRIIIALIETVVVPITANNKEEAEDQIVAFVKARCESSGIPPENFFYDSGMRTGLVSAFGRLWSVHTNPIDCGGTPTDKKVSEQIEMTCKEYYSKFITELWYSVRHAVEAGQWRGLTEDVIMEFSQREWTVVGKNKIEVEPKAKMKLKCFVGGTLISTPQGEVPIENIRPGDVVLTPFGESRVEITHCNEVPEHLHEVSFSNGTSLIGTGEHKIFTWNRGWVNIVALSLTSTVEPVTNLPLWNLANLLFTKTTSTTFKHWVDIISEAGTKKIPGRREFYTELCGKTTMGLFLKVFMFIMSMVIGKIIAFTTFVSLRLVNTTLNTCARAGETLRFVPRCLLACLTGLGGLRYGIVQRLEENGTGRTGFGTGASGCNRQGPARFAVNHLSITGPMRSFVPKNAPTPTSIHSISTSLQSVWCAIKSLWRNATSADSIAVKSVQQLPCGKFVKVYDLTLFKHNAYYANGVLVSNCGRSPDLADAVAIGLFGAKQLGFVINRLVNPAEESKRGDWMAELRKKQSDLRRSKELNYAA